MSVKKETTRTRYKKTSSALRHILNYGALPQGLGKYYDGFYPLQLYNDRYGCWIWLNRGERYIAIIDRHAVRILKKTKYASLLKAWAHKTHRRVFMVNELHPTSKRLSADSWVSTIALTEYRLIPYMRSDEGRIVPANRDSEGQGTPVSVAEAPLVASSFPYWAADRNDLLNF